MTTLELADLERLCPPPKPRTLAKAIDHVDKHAARFLALSPFCVFASAGADGRWTPPRAAARRALSPLLGGSAC